MLATDTLAAVVPAVARAGNEGAQMQVTIRALAAMFVDGKPLAVGATAQVDKTTADRLVAMGKAARAPEVATVDPAAETATAPAQAKPKPRRRKPKSTGTGGS